MNPQRFSGERKTVKATQIVFAVAIHISGAIVPAMNCHDYITVDLGVLVGKPVVRGTKLAVEFVLGLIAEGWPEEEIMRNYGLTCEQVRACAAYAQQRLSEEKAFALAK